MTIEASHPAFRIALADLTSAADRLSQQQHRLGGEVAALLGGGWSGLAAEAYADGWDGWRAGARQVLAGLVEMRDLLDEVHRDLTGRDVASAAALTTVAGRLAPSLVERLGR